MQKTVTYQVGDRVRHAGRPEWGIGRVQRVEKIAVGDKPAQRVMIRFPNAGLKTLSTLGAELVSVEDAPSEARPPSSSNTLLEREAGKESGWLGEISKDDPEAVMVELPASATDPFRPLRARLEATLDLYRYQPDGRGLIDWAVARSGMDDPLSRFTRHELEEFFDRWRRLRQKHLEKIVGEVQGDDPAHLKSALEKAPRAAREAVERIQSKR